MIRNAKVLFCDNEHGAGDVTFPRTDELRDQDFIEPMTRRMLRAAARKAGWKFSGGRDWCDGCVDSGEAA